MKRPSFQFYPADWLTDASLRMVSIGARGLWIDMICIMHQGSEYGYLKVNGKVILNINLARMVGSTLHEVESWLAELDNAGVYSIDDNNCIYSRRMIRDEELRAVRAAGGILGGNPNLNKVNLKPNLKPTPSSSSSSSSSSSLNTIKPLINKLIDDDFEKFWNDYPRKVNKKAAEKTWLKLKPNLEIVSTALQWQIIYYDWTPDNQTFIPHAQTYLNAERWTEPKLDKKDVTFTNKSYTSQRDESRTIAASSIFKDKYIAEQSGIFLESDYEKIS